MIISKGVCLSINIPPFYKNSLILNTAKAQLEEYLYKIFGKGENRLNISFNVMSCEDLQHDGFILNVSDGCIEIISPLERGVLHGAYELLKALGCLFMFPKKSMEVVPRHESFVLENGKRVKNPLIELRGLCLYQLGKKTITQALECIDFMAKNCYNLLLTSIHREDDTDGFCHEILFKEVQEQLLPLLQSRGIVIDMSEHSTDCFFPRDKLFKQRPEWFSLQNGKRTAGQICYANKEAVESYISAFVEYVKNNHSFQIIGTWPLDGGGYCQCEECQNPLLIYNVVCQIAEKIGEVRPDLIVEHLAYTPQSFTRPSQPLPKNMSVLVCSEKGTIAYEWGKCAQNSGGAFYFDYCTGDNYRYRANTIINPYYINTMVNNFATYKYRGIVSLYLPITAWWQSGINYWLLGESYYNPFESAEQQMERLAAGLFGKENAHILKDALYLTVSRLQSKLLWSSHPHKHTYMAGHNDNRPKQLDALHLKEYCEIYRQIMQIIDNADLNVMTAYEKQQLEYFKAYLALQKIYYTDIDMFDSATQNESQANRYLSALSKLEQSPDNPFISENYARWRIIGRDNILKSTKDHNAYEANAK